MEKTFFLKKSYDSVIPHTIVAYVLTIAFVLFKIVRDKELSVVSGLSILFLTAILILVIKHDISTGLYIKGVNMYYRNLKSTKINVEDIVGVKIIQAYSVSKYKTFYPIKNTKGEMLHSAFFLRSLTEEMYHYKKGDLWFNNEYKKHIICSTVYEQNVIDYIKNINPNIKIIQ